MSSDIALRVENLGKKYTIRHKDHDHVTLAQSALHRLRHPRGAIGREEFWALNDVSFEVPRGEVLGVIGHNGAGKSTLLKILSRITAPTTGRVEVFGRIGSLLEVGTGFHPELTGRENVYLNGSILGMKKREIDRQFDAIVDFSGVEQFLDTPVKRYSSGMYVRLAFAVAAHLDTEILLLDEVLAVGDPDFQSRSLERIRNLSGDGRSIVFVSHNRALVSALTRTAIALSQGRIVDSGPTEFVLDRSFRKVDSRSEFRRLQGVGEHVRLTRAVCEDIGTDEKNSLRLTVEVETDIAIVAWRINATIRSELGAAIGSTFGPTMGGLSKGQRAAAATIVRDLPLAPGCYTLDISIWVGNDSDSGFDAVDVVAGACTVNIPDLDGGTWETSWGYLRLKSETFHG